jgi:hypothetical protein
VQLQVLGPVGGGGFDGRFPPAANVNVSASRRFKVSRCNARWVTVFFTILPPSNVLEKEFTRTCLL